MALLVGRLLLLLSAPGLGKPPVDVIAHSMGNYALSSAIQAIGHSKGELLERRALEQVLLCAADVGYMALSDPYALEPLPGLAKAVSVYTNAGDIVLGLSADIHGGRARLGMFGPYEFEKLPSNVFWIDSTDLLTAEGERSSHAYFRTSEGVRKDIGQVLAGNAQDQIKPRHRIGRTNKYVLPFDTTTPYARERGYV